MSMEDERLEENRLPTAGIDWASADHVVAVVDARGIQSDRFAVAHTASGLRRLVGRLHRAGVGGVAIEGPDGPVVEALLEAGLEVFVIAPNQVKNLRSRYGSAGNKDDRFDAYMLADVLRTDRARLRPLTRDSDQTLTLPMTVRTRQDLVTARVAMANQLRGHLETVFPGAIGLFRDIDSTISLTFVARFPSQDKADKQAKACLYKFIVPEVVAVSGATYGIQVRNAEDIGFVRSDAEGLFITGTAP